MTSILIGATAEPEGFPVLKGPYLGQNPPGMTPEVFAPGIISTDATDGTLYFFTSNVGGDRDIYWVDARVIEEFRPKEID